MCSYGDFSALSDVVDKETALFIKGEVTDGIIAPGFSTEAFEILKEKKGGAFVVLQVDEDYQAPVVEYREVYGLVLEQKRNDAKINSDWFGESVTENRSLPQKALQDLIVCSIGVKYTQSNTVGYAINGQVIGMGAGQQSRVDCVKLAGRKTRTWWLRFHPKVRLLNFKPGTKRTERVNARVQYIEGDMTEPEQKAWVALFSSPPPPFLEEEKVEFLKTLSGVALSSDAFFPFRDSIDQASKFGVKFVAQPLGSIADEEVANACNEYGMVMVKSANRLFHH
eukprot:TRINITY_DN6299_c0_g1_i12.p1 TRINITY_DN6299_c0_g1~~TRINITY_DN6299_c0_g1_i12.p1  ORF type:complete len:281 (+),score=46.92 TRINITY_DN6299_c0_g1_i12:83-925(+)